MSETSRPLPATLPLPPPPRGIRQWPVWCGIGAMWLMAQLPWSLQRGLGRTLGALLRWALTSRRAVVRANLAVCFPEQTDVWREALLRENFAALGIGLFEFARAWWGRIEPMRRTARYVGVEALRQVLDQGRGAILISGHFMTLEICGRLLCEKIPLAGMYRPHDTAAMEWAVKRGRLRYACAMFGRDELRPALRHLKQGGALWFAPDQDTLRGDNVFVPFFGEPARSLTSTHQLARMSGAAVFAFFHRREADGSYTLEVKPAFEDFPGGDAAADTARVMAAIEAMARAAPSQYLWMHKRFKRRPEGAAPIYD
ncbi:LpxL/LpxP family Kdo(2)-lipid IV(A) lauroyl/palmitoleoyl acyltransferase [Xanthomonadaceae bacterium XH05]|jgi:KDO2-lipid IV(A) lauroyltransferase|nr:LpxL/LpxP family Kdo(2)-lipid IV(A) lauroyl/palmitoleoyl acyltransferase [Xanthomonadaceae bacterium XH05]